MRLWIFRSFFFIALSLASNASRADDDGFELLCTSAYSAIASSDLATLQKVLDTDKRCLDFSWKQYSLLTFAIARKNAMALSIVVKTPGSPQVDPEKKDPAGRIPLQMSVDQGFYKGTAILATLGRNNSIIYRGKSVRLFDLSLLVGEDDLAEAVLNSITDLSELYYGGDKPPAFVFVEKGMAKGLKVLVGRWPDELHRKWSTFEPIHYAYFGPFNDSKNRFPFSPALVEMLKAQGASINDGGRPGFPLSALRSALVLGGSSLRDAIRADLRRDQTFWMKMGFFVFDVVDNPILFDFFRDWGFDLSFARAGTWLRNDVCPLTNYLADENKWKLVATDLGWSAVVHDSCRAARESDWSPPWAGIRGLEPKEAYRRLIAADTVDPRPKCDELMRDRPWDANQPRYPGVMGQFAAEDFDLQELRDCIALHFQFEKVYPSKIERERWNAWKDLYYFLKRPGVLNATGLLESSAKSCDFSVYRLLHGLGLAPVTPVTMSPCEQAKPTESPMNIIYRSGGQVATWDNYGQDVYQFYLKYNYYSNLEPDAWDALNAEDACHLLVYLARISNQMKTRFVRGAPDVWYRMYDRIKEGVMASKAALSHGACDLDDPVTHDLLANSEFDITMPRFDRKTEAVSSEIRELVENRRRRP